jgi:malate synthase
MAVTRQGIKGFHTNNAPMGRRERELPAGFLPFFTPFHHKFAARHRALVAARRAALEQSLHGNKPNHLPPSAATNEDWRIELPAWCADQRNQMTGPADDAELVVKMLNSGAPGVMLDLEDSTVNEWEHQSLGVENILQALAGSLSYHDAKRGGAVGIKSSNTVIWIRARGLHLHQGGVIDGELCSASLFDVARIVFAVDPADLKHPLAFYIPKSESAEEALFWRDIFETLAQARGWPKNYIKCMALVEAHPLAYQMEEFLYHLRDHILGLNLGRWDYMASLIHFNLDDARWLLPDRNTIPHDVPFFQNLRQLLPEICHQRGALAIGGMTALYPSRQDPDLNARALAALQKDKKNEADSLMDGAWTGHPDQNQVALEQFPTPNQLHARRPAAERRPDLRPVPAGIGKRTLEGTRAAIRTVIRYRNGVLNGKGASLLDGYMEDLATDRIYRLMLAQRLEHSRVMPVVDASGDPVVHTPELLSSLFAEELDIITAQPPRGEIGTPGTLQEARRIAEAMVLNHEFDPS